MGHFKGYFEGSKKSRPPGNGPLCSLPKTKKIISHIFKNQQCIGIFMFLCYQSPYLISHWTSEAKKYNVPCHHSCADPTSDINDIYVEKTPRNVPVGKKSAKVYHCLYSSIEQLQVAL
jgi:hypothetical protein